MATRMAGLQTRFVQRARANGITILTRRDWKSRLPLVYAKRAVTKRHDPYPSGTVWQHITVTKDGGNSVAAFKDDCRTVEAIGQARFGTGCSYNFMVDMETGMVGVGQPLRSKGSHTVMKKARPGYSYDQNKVAWAIVCIGMPGDNLSEKAKRAITMLIVTALEVGVLTKDFDYNPHSFAAAKDCPTDAVRNKMPEIKREALEIYERRH